MAIAVQRIDNLLQQIGNPYTLLIAEDGSTDNTLRVAKDLTFSYPNLKVVHSDLKLGRGRALRNAWLSSKADVYVFMDADLATDIKFLPQLVERMQADGLDLITGSRYSPGSNLQRPRLRKAVSLAYNAFVRTVFRTKMADHQCGFKAFSRVAVQKILPLTRENGWAWDTEVIVYLANLGFKIAELPVAWKEMKGTRTPIVRLLRDIREHGIALIRIMIRSRSLRNSRNVAICG